MKKAAQKPQDTLDQQEVEDALDEALGEAKDPVQIAAETMLGDLMKLAVENAKALPKSWQELSEREQDDYLHRIESQCRAAVVQAVSIIASKGALRVPIEVTQTTIKDGVKVQIELLNRHDVIHMLECGSRYAMLVLSDASEFVGGEKPKAEKDQRALDLDEGNDD